MLNPIPFVPVKRAVYKRLKSALETDAADVTLAPFAAKPTHPLPFAVISRFSSEEDAFKDQDFAVEITVQIDIYDTLERHEDVLSLIGTIAYRLRAEKLDIDGSGFNNIHQMGRIDRSDAFPEWDSERFLIHGVLKFTFYLQTI